ncbi:efflux RND transporter permease subunit [Terrarubrum flagellatum]|uniref:efflux RND transporter permease subunit n=1 Tax=Terrirubrum flagellatum TaxID=2895980 RepID=UPI003144D7C7
MSLPELCIRRPVMTTLLMLSFVIFGLFAYKKLPVAALPRVDYPTINVSVQMPGASPETMAASVAAPLERAFATISGLDSLTSVSTQANTQITLQFNLDREIDGASLDVQSQISATLRRLPAELPAPPSFRKVNPGDTPILFLALKSETMPLSEVNEYAENILAQQITQLPGVAQVNIFGQQKYAVRIYVDPKAASARGLALNDVRNAINAANSNAPVGTLRGENQRVTIEATGQLRRAENYNNLIVATKNGVPVKLEDIATPKDSVYNDQTAGWFNNDRAIVLAIFRQSDANTVETVDRIKATLPAFQAQLPPSVSLIVNNDRSISIRESVEDVQFTLLLSVALVIMVIFVFLKRLSATVIPTLALPVSIVGTFGFMQLFGYSLDNISLLALTLAVGFVVDDAIVMLENIVRHIEEGMKPFTAALVGSREIGFTIISITLSLIAVFIPVFFMGGVVGRVFREFAVTISVTILVSGFVSLTLTPMLCARFLKEEDHHRKVGLLERILEGWFQAMLWLYRVALDFVLKFRLVFLLLTFVTGWYSVHLYQTVPRGFFPQEDTGLLTAFTESAPDTSFEAMVERQKQIAAIVGADPAVDYFSSNIGFGGAINQGFLFVALKPKDTRDRVEVILSRLRRETAKVAGITFVARPVQNINLNAGRQSRGNYQYTLTSPDLKALFDFAPTMLAKLRTLDELRDASLDLQLTNPQAAVDIDRERAATLGVSQDAIKQTLYNAFGSREISTIYTPATDYSVLMEATRDFQSDATALSQIYVKSSTGQNVPLDAVASVRRTVGPLAVARVAQQPAVTISFNLKEGTALGIATAAIRQAEREIGMPPSIIGTFSGTAQIFEQAVAGQLLLATAAVFVIYIVLGVLYESFIHPITILSGLPSAGIGALLSLQLYNMDLSVVAMIGILMLIGIVKKNAIMMVDFAIERRRHGDDALTAIREAALVRFRPIMMTSFAAIFGVLPIAIGHGAGAELRQPLGIAVCGGLILSQLLTLFITPVVYYYLDKIDSRMKEKSRDEHADAAHGAHGAHHGHGAHPAPAGHGAPPAVPAE